MGDGGPRALVMVVDDDAGCREALVTILEMEGVDACSAANGREALARLRRREVRPQAIVLDLEMPVMSGWEFRREQLGDPALRDIPVLVASASEPGPIPADGFLRKPYDVDTLLAAIAAVTSPRRAA